MLQVELLSAGGGGPYGTPFVTITLVLLGHVVSL